LFAPDDCILGLFPGVPFPKSPKILFAEPDRIKLPAPEISPLETTLPPVTEPVALAFPFVTV